MNDSYLNSIFKKSNDSADRRRYRVKCDLANAAEIYCLKMYGCDQLIRDDNIPQPVIVY